jgi:hypothetical protein
MQLSQISRFDMLAILMLPHFFSISSLVVNVKTDVLLIVKKRALNELTT